MIAKQQYHRLMKEYQSTENVTTSAMKADISRPTARKYLEAQQPPDRLQVKHTWRTRPEGSSVLCALCLHPIGYYDKTWAGVMCPTDEVIAHLLMMRGSEMKFWANANQHSVEHPAAGI